MRSYFRYRAVFDCIFSALVVGVVFASDYIQLFDMHHLVRDERIYLTTATIAATLLGFSLASASFLISHTRSESMDFLRKSKSFAQLISLLRSALWRFFTLSGISLACFSIKSFSYNWPIILLIFFFIHTVLAAITLIWTVAAILRLTK